MRIWHSRVTSIEKAIRLAANEQRDSRMPRKEVGNLDVQGDKIKCLLSVQPIAWVDRDANGQHKEKCSL